MMLSTTFDATADALYIQISHASVARTDQLDNWTLVDVDSTGAGGGRGGDSPGPAVASCRVLQPLPAQAVIG